MGHLSWSVIPYLVEIKVPVFRIGRYGKVGFPLFFAGMQSIPILAGKKYIPNFECSRNSRKIHFVRRMQKHESIGD